MRVRHIPQAITPECLFSVLESWCRKGAGHKTHTLRVLSAFVSGAAIEAMEPLFDVFLADGNSIHLIVGVDRGGTDKAAVQRIWALRRCYRKQLTCEVFNVRARTSIFHPKLYLYQANGTLCAVVGSPNLTVGGLAANFESMLLYEDLGLSSHVAKELLTIWDTYAKPKPPLEASFLRPLNVSLMRRLAARLPVQSSEEEAVQRRHVQTLWRPLSRVALPRSGRIRPRRRIGRRATSYLLIDVLQETRKTQMQLPLAVVEEFFGIDRDRPADIRLSVITAEGLSQPIDRHVVVSTGREGRRLMRRIEMPTIHGLARPLAMVFLRLREPMGFAYSLLSRGTSEYRVADRILQRSGQQGNAKRRYLIGHTGDRHWRAVSAPLQTIER